ncbi:MAG: glycine--tRNA ligase, partial [Halobacteriaceae archaeon]
MNELSQLARRRGFFFPSNEAYGGVSGFYTYGPQGSAMKQNIEDVWRDRFITKQNNMEIDAPTVFPEDVFDASSHLETFNDLLIECQHCQESHRADHLIEDNTDIDEAEHFSPEEISDIIAEHEISCPTCGEPLIDQPVNEFNLMFKTNIGPSSHNPGYLRPETAQGIFVEFPRLKEYARGQLPFGVGQIGRAYRNEISPRNALIRVREFTQAELEMFIDPNSDSPTIEQVEDVTLTLYSAFAQERNEGHVTKSVTEALDSDIINNEWIAYYLGLAKQWYQRIGVDMDRFRFRQHQSGELSHYAVDCWDAEAEVDGDWFELAGFAYRSDYDLQKHTEHSDEEFTIFKQYDEPKTVESVSVDPDMSYLGPQFGEKAAAIAEAIQSKAEREPTAFDHDEISVEVDDETYTIPRDKTGFERQQVTKSGHHITPHIIEPSFGVGRALYTVFCHAYETDEVNGETRNVLRLE